jgi:hypothetical protein
MLHLRLPSRYARVRVRAVAFAAITLITASACFPDDPIEVDTSSITVQVRDAGSNPVAGAQITWWPAELSESQASAVGATATSGDITFDVLTVWEDVQIRVSPPEGFAVAGAQSNPVDVALLQGLTTVTFRVVAQ